VEDVEFATSLFQKVPAFLLGQILSVRTERLLDIVVNDAKDEEKQHAHALREWQMNSSGATWSVLVEALIELGSRSSAQAASIEKGLISIIHIFCVVYFLLWRSGLLLDGIASRVNFIDNYIRLKGALYYSHVGGTTRD